MSTIELCAPKCVLRFARSKNCAKKSVLPGGTPLCTCVSLLVSEKNTERPRSKATKRPANGTNTCTWQATSTKNKIEQSCEGKKGNLIKQIDGKVVVVAVLVVAAAGRRLCDEERREMSAERMGQLIFT